MLWDSTVTKINALHNHTDTYIVTTVWLLSRCRRVVIIHYCRKFYYSLYTMLEQDYQKLQAGKTHLSRQLTRKNAQDKTTRERKMASTVKLMPVTL